MKIVDAKVIVCSLHRPGRRHDVWSTERYLRSVPPLFARLREELGPDVHLLHDAHHRLTPIEAGRLGRDLEPYHGCRFQDGNLHPGEAPGLGVEIDETLAEDHLYVRAYLPVNRREDGTVHDW